LGRPENCEAPKNTAATAGNRYPGPIELENVPTFIENSTPASPASSADVTNEPHMSRSVRTPARRAASAFPPVA
jgi:hypothetical protein